MFSRTGVAAYKEDITNTVLLCNSIGNPQQKFKSVHIAGTNGKGSVSHMLAAVFQQSGYKTGLYTSPHLKDFRERIKINGAMISEKEVIEFTEQTKGITEEIEPSFFELTVAMAFDHFERHSVDIAIIETGLGGRLDSTNIINPVLSVITNIGYDHMNILGDTLDKIAFEKAGIIKKETPVVIGESLAETRIIFSEKAKQNNAPIVYADEDFAIIQVTHADNFLNVQLHNKITNFENLYSCDLMGIYQQKNIRTVVASIQQLRIAGFHLKEDDVKQALKNVTKLTGLHGRWETIHQHPKVVVDVAHNPDGIRQLREQLLLCNYKNLRIIIGLAKDKDAAKVLSLLPKNAFYYFTKAQIPRALDEHELKENASAYKLKGDAFAEVNTALEKAIIEASDDDLIIVCGSVFLVGELNELPM